MIQKSINIDNTSKYWYYNDEQDKVWWFFKNFKKNNSVIEFYKKYYLLTKKYQILNIVDDNYFHDLSQKKRTNNLSHLYKKNDKKLIFPTCLFTKVEGVIEKNTIIDVNELHVITDTNKHHINYAYDEPIRIVEFGKKNNDEYINDIYIYIKNDVFFETLYNKKTYRSENELIRKGGVDNSELAYLNTPRFNSFFRDFKKLCLSYGAEFSYEIDIYETGNLVSPDGIFINNEIIYYEDVADLLDEKYRIVDLKASKNYFSNHKITIKPKINLEHTPEILNEFTLKIENKSKNVFSIYDVESEQDIMFSKGKWIFILFAGYSGSDIKMVEEVLEISNQFPDLNFAFKPFMDDRKIQDFTKVSVLRKVTPILLKRKNNTTKLISSSIKNESEIKELISLI